MGTLGEEKAPMENMPWTTMIWHVAEHVLEHRVTSGCKKSLPNHGRRTERESLLLGIVYNCQNNPHSFVSQHTSIPGTLLLTRSDYVPDMVAGSPSAIPVVRHVHRAGYIVIIYYGWWYSIAIMVVCGPGPPCCQKLGYVRKTITVCLNSKPVTSSTRKEVLLTQKVLV